MPTSVFTGYFIELLFKMAEKIKVVERRGFKKIIGIFFTFFLTDTLNSLLLLFKKNKKYSFDASKYFGINLGSSTTSPQGWIGISGGVTIFFLNMPSFLLRLVYPFSGRAKKSSFSEFYQKVKTSRILHHNLFYGIPFKDAAVSNVFSSHFFEHLSYDSAQFLAHEAFRVLKPGGMIHIVVPSLESDVEKMKQAVDDFYKGDPSAARYQLTETYVDLTDPFSHHRFMYTFTDMKKLLSDAGFKNITDVERFKGAMPDIAPLENRPGLIVEAIKE